eukprot:gene9014-9978_t
MSPPPVKNKPTIASNPIVNGPCDGELNDNNNADGIERSRKLSNEKWDQQKSRIDQLLSTLKTEMQEVKVMDKKLTRQFIQLGGKIQKIKEDEKQFFEELTQQGQALFEDDGEDNEAYLENDNATTVTVMEDTKL